MAKIIDRHTMHGAALIQIAEHERFTSINLVDLPNSQSHRAFRVNQNIGVFFSTSRKRTEKYGEFRFRFGEKNIADIEALKRAVPNTFLALICMEQGIREICCISYSEFSEFIAVRRSALASLGEREDAVSICVVLRKGKGKLFRVYVDNPRTKGKYLSGLDVARSDFPDRIFA